MQYAKLAWYAQVMPTECFFIKLSKNVLTFQFLKISGGSGKICFHFIDDIIVGFNSVLLRLDHRQLALKREKSIRGWNQGADTVILNCKTYCCANILMWTNLECCFQLFVFSLNFTKLLSHLLVEWLYVLTPLVGLSHLILEVNILRSDETDLIHQFGVCLGEFVHVLLEGGGVSLQGGGPLLEGAHQTQRHPVPFWELPGRPQPLGEVQPLTRDQREDANEGQDVP